MPIKLIFLLNASKLEKIISESKDKLKYCTGESRAVGAKLLELD